MLGWFKRPSLSSVEAELVVAEERAKTLAEAAWYWEEKYNKLRDECQNGHLLPGEVCITDAEMAMSTEVEYYKNRCEALTKFANSAIDRLMGIKKDNDAANHRIDIVIETLNKEVNEIECGK